MTALGATSCFKCTLVQKASVTMNLNSPPVRTLTHPAVVVVAAAVLLFFSLFVASSHTVVGSALSALSGRASHQYEDRVGPHRWVTYAIVSIADETHVFSDTGPYSNDALTKAMQFIRERADPATPYEFYQVRFTRFFSRHTGLIFPMTSRERFVVDANVFDPKAYDEVPRAPRKVAVDAFIGAWPAHANYATRLLAEDDFTIQRISWVGVVFDAICYALIAFIGVGIWANFARRRQRRARPSPSP